MYKLLLSLLVVLILSSGDSFARERRKLVDLNPDTEYTLRHRQIKDKQLQRQMVRDSVAKLKKRADKLGDRCVAISSLKMDYTRNRTVTDSKKLAWADSLIAILGQTSPKDAEKARKDIAKGKVNSKLMPLINELEPIYKAKYYETKALTETDPQIPIPMIDVVDTIKNDYYRPYVFKNCFVSRLDEIDLYGMTKDWPWVYEDGDDGIHHHFQEYPVKTQYYIYDSCPEYRISHGVAYDNEGKLVRVLYMRREGIDRFGTVPQPRIDFDSRRSSEMNELLRIAFNDNMYDIRSQSPHILHYIKTQIGLEDFTDTEKANLQKTRKKQGQYISNVMEADASTKSGRKQREYNSTAFALAEFDKYGPDYYSKEGEAWIRQITSDMRNILKSPYIVERIDNTSFKTTYVNKELKPIYEITYSFAQGDKPYSIEKQTKVKKL